MIKQGRSDLKHYLAPSSSAEMDVHSTPGIFWSFYDDNEIAIVYVVFNLLFDCLFGDVNATTASFNHARMDR